jgi:hypothetical protein
MDTEFILRTRLENVNERSPAEEAALGRQIFQKLCARLSELGIHPEPRPFHSKAIPDVIVTAMGKDFFFEPQNWEATEWLCRRFGLTVKNAQARDKIRVQSSERQAVIAEMKSAGFEVLC